MNRKKNDILDFLINITATYINSNIIIRRIIVTFFIFQKVYRTCIIHRNKYKYKGTNKFNFFKIHIEYNIHENVCDSNNPWCIIARWGI